MFISVTVTAAAVPPNVAFMPVWSPLPRTVTAVPPAADPDEGDSVPMARGPLASCTILRPLVVTANNRWPFFVSGKKATVRPVDVRVQHGKGFRKVNTQAKLTVVSIADVNASVNSGSGRRSRGGTIEEWLVQQGAGRMDGDAEDGHAIGNGP